MPLTEIRYDNLSRISILFSTLLAGLSIPEILVILGHLKLNYIKISNYSETVRSRNMHEHWFLLGWSHDMHILISVEQQWFHNSLYDFCIYYQYVGTTRHASKKNYLIIDFNNKLSEWNLATLFVLNILDISFIICTMRTQLCSLFYADCQLALL